MVRTHEDLDSDRIDRIRKQVVKEGDTLIECNKDFYIHVNKNKLMVIDSRTFMPIDPRILNLSASLTLGLSIHIDKYIEAFNICKAYSLKQKTFEQNRNFYSVYLEPTKDHAYLDMVVLLTDENNIVCDIMIRSFDHKEESDLDKLGIVPAFKYPSSTDIWQALDASTHNLDIVAYNRTKSAEVVIDEDNREYAIVEYLPEYMVQSLFKLTVKRGYKLNELTYCLNEEGE